MRRRRTGPTKDESEYEVIVVVRGPIQEDLGRLINGEY